MRMPSINRKTYSFPAEILLPVTGLMFIGLLALYAATYRQGWGGSIYFWRQLWWFLVGSLLAIGIAILEPVRIYNNSYAFYASAIIFLIFVALAGTGSGSRRWLDLGFLRFQPSEFAKIAVVLGVARYLSDLGPRQINRFSVFFKAVVLVLIPMILVLRQPDLGTALIIGLTFLPMMFWAGLSFFRILMLLAPMVSLFAASHLVAFFCVIVLILAVNLYYRKGLKVLLLNFFINIGVGILMPFLWGGLHVYQQQRILTFIGLAADPRGAGYQVIQSKIAIGAGGLWGKGFLQGTQTNLNFLPAPHTDFIFAVIGEEFGFLGVSIVCLLYLFLLLSFIKLAKRADKRFYSLAFVGITTVLASHIFINIGMTLGLLPVTGLPLPFISYGGSFLLLCLMTVGLVINFSKR